jgi:tetratricopeptide (TPR) repeat protein
MGIGPLTPVLALESIASVDPTTTVTSAQPVEVIPLDSDARKFFNEARALESQGNMAAAQRLYVKITKISPRFIYGWSNLGNTQTAFGDLDAAEASYSTSIDLCNESIRTTTTTTEQMGFKPTRCSDQYLLLLNRGSLRLNNGRVQDALLDLQRASDLRGQPDAMVLQNLARAKELNGMYLQADSDYTMAISMTSNEVNPFWLRSALVKFQLGDDQDGMDLLKRVANRFPEVPEVRAAYATFLAAQGKQIDAQQKFLEIPDRQRLKYRDRDYLTKTVAWPPRMIDILLGKVVPAVGDYDNNSSSNKMI